MAKTVPIEHCTGCSACLFCCPKRAITMAEDREGFLYPHIDLERCNDCGLCMEKCPVSIKSNQRLSVVPEVYAAWSKDPDILRESSSGGAFSEIARPILDNDGVVFGAAFDDEMTVRHIAVSSWKELGKLRGSKYVQSDVGDTYQDVKVLLKSGRKVLYSGTPCQVAGLYAVVGRGHDNLLTCDLICHGVPSPKVFRMAVRNLESKYKSKVIEFKFREKTNGWLYPTIYIKFFDGRIVREHNMDNHYNRGFLKNIYLRPCCYSCPTKSTALCADITIGDFWQLTKYQPSLINHSGTSSILIWTLKGRSAIEQNKEIISLYRCSYDFVEKDSNLLKSPKLSPERDGFFDNIDNLSFKKLTQKYMRPRIAPVRWLANIRRGLRAQNRSK